jgi:hypothetical protein
MAATTQDFHDLASLCFNLEGKYEPGHETRQELYKLRVRINILLNQRLTEIETERWQALNKRVIRKR